MQGGESTAEEMCLSFLTFYPLPASDILDVCFSSVTQAAFIDFSIYLKWEQSHDTTIISYNKILIIIILHFISALSIQI